MDNNELLRSAREQFEGEGFSYESGMSEIANGDIYSKWNLPGTIETVASFQYELETGEFEGVTFSLYGQENELLREFHVPVVSLEDIVALSVNV